MGGEPSMGGEPGMGGAPGGMGGSPPMCDYTAPNTCPTSMQLGAVAGDENDPSISFSGDTDMWLEILIEEKDSSIFEEDLSYTVVLESPSGMDYDLVVLPGPQDGPPNCSANSLTVQVQGSTETASQGWDDDQGIGGEDDDRWVSIQVVHISGGMCGAGAEWTVTVTGHT
jgi:hypothetical protein